MKKIFILNGAATSGKDKFVEFVKEFIPSMHYSYVLNSKEAAMEYFGWDGGKTERDRKFLADLNTLSSEYNDQPFKDVKSLVDDFLGNDLDDEYKFLFIDAREISAIDRMKQAFNAKTIFVIRSGVAAIRSNHADAQTAENYDYDYIIENNGSLDSLRNRAREFVEYVIRLS